MGSEDLKIRERQPGNDQSFRFSEDFLVSCLEKILNPEIYIVTSKPNQLKNIFHRENGRSLGIIPEASIENIKTNKKAFFEVKKQGANGNAEERACKHHTLQFYKTIKEKFGYDYHPFFTVFCDNLATDSRYTTKYKYLIESSQYLCWVNYEEKYLEDFIKSICSTYLDK